MSRSDNSGQRNGARLGDRARVSTDVFGSRAAQRATPVVLVSRNGMMGRRGPRAQKGGEGREKMEEGTLGLEVTGSVLASIHRPRGKERANEASDSG